jgi:hypothetical protein
LELLVVNFASNLKKYQSGIKTKLEKFNKESNSYLTIIEKQSETGKMIHQQLVQY